MKILITILILFCTLQSFAQNIDSLFTKIKLPEDLTATVEKDSGAAFVFPKYCVSKVTFNYKLTSVYFYMFVYESSDSIAFKQSEYNYWMVSGCNVEPNNDMNKNFKSFTKGGYYFLLQRCACKTGENKDCAELAKRINEWKNN